jgi:hypothetical protein
MDNTSAIIGGSGNSWWVRTARTKHLGFSSAKWAVHFCETTGRTNWVMDGEEC